MLNQDQIDQFVNLVDEAGYGIDDSEVVATQDTVADFIGTWGSPDEVDEGLHIWRKLQRIAGERRRDLLVYDFGAARAAATI